MPLNQLVVRLYILPEACLQTFYVDVMFLDGLYMYNNIYQLSLLSLHWLPIAAEGAVYIQDDYRNPENIELHVVMFTPCTFYTCSYGRWVYFNELYSQRNRRTSNCLC